MSKLVVFLVLLGGCLPKLPPYTTTAALVETIPSMTFREVAEQLGAPPYDILASHEDGYTIAVWHSMHDAFQPRFPIRKNGLQPSARLSDLERVFFVFRHGKLVFFVTESALHIPKVTRVGQKAAPADGASKGGLAALLGSKPDDVTAVMVAIEAEIFHRATSGPGALLDTVHLGDSVLNWNHIPVVSVPGDEKN